MNISIKLKLYLLVIFSVLSIAVAIGLSFKFLLSELFYNTAKEKLSYNFKYITHDFRHMESETQDGSDFIKSHLVSRKYVLEDKEVLAEELSEYTQYTDFEAVYILDKNKVLLAFAKKNQDSFIYGTKLNESVDILQQNMSKQYYAVDREGNVNIVTQQVYKKDGEVLAYIKIVAKLDQSYFQEITLKLGNDISYTVNDIDLDKQTVTPLFLKNYDILDIFESQDIYSATVALPTLKDIVYITAKVNKIALGQSIQKVYEKIFFIIMIVTMFLFIISIYFIAVWIGKPLKKIYTEIENIENNTYQEKVLAIPKNEIESILMTLNTMYKSIKYEQDLLFKKDKKLEEYNVKLKENISELQMKTNILVVQAKYLDRLQSIANIGIVELNRQNGTFYWSQQIYRILGVKESEDYTDYTSFLHFVHPEDKELLAQAHNAVFVESTDYKLTYRIVRTDEKIRYVEEKGSYKLNEKNEIVSIFGTIFDITEKYLLNKKLNELNKDLDEKIQEEIDKNTQKDKQLFAQSRLAQMGEMVSMIAHQWRQPLSAISTTAIDLDIRIDLNSYDLDTSWGQEECRTYFSAKLNNIASYVNNLTGTIDDFRNFYKPNKASVNISFETVVKKAVNIIGASLENNNIQLEYNYKSDKTMQMYDSEMMQVILNILQNSVDNFKERDIKHPKIVITTEDEKILICDNGKGIDKIIVDKIFDPYFSTKSEKNGTGLGLYMSSVIIREHHNGKLYVNNIDDGICFVIDLKVSEND